MLKLCKDPWTHESKSHCPGWSWHLSFWETAGHHDILSKKDVQVCELSIWENPSQARSAVEIHRGTRCCFYADSTYGIFRNLDEPSTCESLSAVGFCPEVWTSLLIQRDVYSAHCTDPVVCVDVAWTERCLAEQSGGGVSRGTEILLHLYQIYLTGIVATSKNTA